MDIFSGRLENPCLGFFVYRPGKVAKDESIGELAHCLTGDILECIAHLEQAYEAVKPLETLLTDLDEELRPSGLNLFARIYKETLQRILPASVAAAPYPITPRHEEPVPAFPAGRCYD